ncbi:2-hydroxyacid dehydrogenase [Dokdonia sinensis]|uniref:2-hydroxyacid dehydrogenase n=1 Tax=Dokdonia sinensis TaxID=2479847 RepID=A0A3M0GHP2_9FLAO|nr:NAD(P)-dependent oxidoreductase [Dokdonia sinensis]RMB64097.1 2-hydroxyacid dehydrogenase [Dokdonia sinensis]
MKTLIYSAKDFEIPFLEDANNDVHSFKYIPDRLTTHTAMMALGFEAISIFSADDASEIVLQKLKDFGVEHITLRSAGYDNVNLRVAKRLGFKVANAPEYSPNAVAEHAIALLLALNRKITLSRKQTQHYDFTLTNLIGFDLVGKTVGVVGTGRIGSVIVKILNGFGCNIHATDPVEDEYLKTTFDVSYVDIDTICSQSDVVILSVPLNQETHQLIDRSKLELMHKNALLINVARGAVVHTNDVLEYVNRKRVGGYATDVYDKESGVFFYDRSKDRPDDEVLEKMLNHDRILLTPHQAFATREAIENIAKTTASNLNSWQRGTNPQTELTVSKELLLNN